MTYRSPLRIQWERDKRKFEAQAQGAGDHAVIARALLAVMPGLIDFMEGELPRQTRPLMVLEACTAAICNVAFQAIAATTSGLDRREALRIMHMILESDVGGRLDSGQTSAQIILPAGVH